MPGHPDDLHHHDMIGHVAPDTAIRFAYGSLVRVLRAYETPPRPISVVYLPTRMPSPAVQALVAMLRRRSGMPWPATAA